MANEPLGWPEQDGARVRDLLRLCGRTRDRAERAALLARVAGELDRAAGEIVCGDRDRSSARELAAALRGQASMARYVADLERHDRAREAAGSS